MADASFLQATDKEIFASSKIYPSKHCSACMIYNFVLKNSHFTVQMSS